MRETARGIDDYTDLGLNEISTEGNVRDPEQMDAEFLASVREHGVIEPLIVTVAADRGPPHYQLVAGFRRFAAADELGLDSVPCRILDLSPQEVDEFRLVENLHRKDLNPIERARALKAFKERHRLTEEKVGQRVGKSQEWVSNQLRLLELPDEAQDLMRRRILSASAGLELLRVKKAPKVLARVLQELGTPGLEPTVQTTHNVVSRVVDGTGHDLTTAGTRFDLAGCAGCGDAVAGTYGDRCLNGRCFEKKRKKADDARHAQLVAAVRGGEESMVDSYDMAQLPVVLDTCPEDCPDSGMVRYGSGPKDRRRACLAADSECRRQKEGEARANMEAGMREGSDRFAEERAKQEAEQRAHEEAERQRLARVEDYLRHRQEELNHPEVRLLCRWVLGEYDGEAFVADAAGLPPDTEDETRKELASRLSTRELGTVALAYLLTRDPEYVPDEIDRLRAAMISQEDATDPEGARLALDPRRLVRLAQCTGSGDCATCADDGCLYHQAEFRQAAAEPTPQAAQEAAVPVECDLDCAACVNADCPNRQAEYCRVAVAEQAAEDAAEASTEAATVYGPHPEVKKCWVIHEPTSPKECLACCSSRDAGEECCEKVVNGPAPFRCPGGLDTCPTLDQGPGERAEAPSATFPVVVIGTGGSMSRVAFVTRSAEAAESGPEVPEESADAPAVDKPSEPDPGPLVAAPAVETGEIPFEDDEPNTPPVGWRCKVYHGPAPDRTFCRDCNAEIFRAQCHECCEEVTGGRAPYVCGMCPEAKNCQRQGGPGLKAAAGGEGVL